MIDHGTKLRAESTVEPPEAVVGAPPPTEAAAGAVSVAVVVGVYKDVAHATIESGAELDALRATRVISLIEHPYALSPDELFPSTLAEFVDSIQSEGFEAINKYLDGTFGLQSSINSWARATAEADKVGIAGSVTFLTYDNEAVTTVENGALINQDVAFRTYASNEHKNNLKSEQVVSIEASNYMELINVAGTFDFSFLTGNIDPWTLEAPQGPSVSLEGGSGGRGGVGGAVFVLLLDNTTHSIVEDGARIYSGDGGGFNMKADEAVFNLAFSQSGADGGKLAVAGTVAYSEQQSDTLAQLGAGAYVTGRNANLYAASLETQVNVAGAVTTGNATGIGISVAVNRVDRSTRAVVGDPDALPSTGSAVAGTNFIDVAEAVNARAIVAGQVWSFSLAASKVSKEQQVPDANPPGGGGGGAGGGGPTGGASLPLGNPGAPAGTGGAPATGQDQKTGIGIAAAGGVNLISDVTQASVTGAGTVKAGSLSLSAENRVMIVAATGGLASVQGDTGNTSVALAGAFSFTELDATTRAFVQDTNFALTANGVDDPAADPTLAISALARGTVISASAGGSLGTASGGTGSGNSTAVAVAGSVSVNRITSATEASVTNADFSFTQGNAELTSSDESSIFAVAGGLSVSLARGQTGGATAASFGIAIAVNQIDARTRSTIGGSAWSWAPSSSGKLLVSADSAQRIEAYTVAGAVAVAQGTSGKGVAGSGAASGSVNLIDLETAARIYDGSVTLPSGTVSVLASDASSIVGAAGGIAVSVGLGGQGSDCGKRHGSKLRG